MSCFLDNCSIHWGVGTGPSGAAHEGTVQVAPGGSLSCHDVAGAAPNAFSGGLGVLISGDANNLVARGTDGGLFAQGVQGAVKAARSDAPYGRTPLPATSEMASPTYNHGGGWDWTNTTGRDVFVIVRGQLRLDYAVMYAGSAGPGDTKYHPSDRTANIAAAGAGLGVTPFNANVTVALFRTNTSLVGGDTNPVVVAKFDPSGMIADNGVTQEKNDWRDFVWTEGVSAGSTLTLAARAWHEGFAQTMNILTGTDDANFSNYGFNLARVKLYALPISVVETVELP